MYMLLASQLLHVYTVCGETLQGLVKVPQKGRWEEEEGGFFDLVSA